MAKISEQSDDEFHDALNEHPSDGKNEQVVNEILKAQEKMSLKDDANEEGEDSTNNKEQQDDGEIIAGSAEVLDDFVDEALLKSKEENMSEEELQQNKEKADGMKLEANELFKNDDANAAITIYSDALMICPTKYPKERAILYGNRAAAKIKLGSCKSAIYDCNHAIDLYPEYVRALLRRAKLYEQDDKLDEALADYKTVYELDPGQKEAREAMVRLPPIIEERNERMKTEMMSKLKDLGNMILKPFGLSTNNFQMQQDPSGSYSINFNQNGS